MTANTMKAILICRTARLLDELRPEVERHGYAVTDAVVRKGGQPLPALLSTAGADLAIIESAGDRGDLSAIDVVARAHPRLGFIMLSPDRNADVLLGAMRAGVREVLASPPRADELAAALQRLAQREPAGAPSARVAAFIACKGGSGATFLATNAAYVIATECGLETVLVDLDLQYGDASYFVSDTPAPLNLADIAGHMERLDAKLLASSLQRIAPRLGLLAAPQAPEAALGITAAQVEQVLDVAARSCEMLVLDLERQIDAVAVKALDRADAVYLVLQNMLPYVRDAQRLVRVLRTLGYPDGKLHLVVNRYDPHGVPSIAQIEEAVGLKVAHTLPDSPREVAEAINTGVPLVKVDAGSGVARAVRRFAAALAGKPLAHTHGWIGRLIGEHD